MRNKYKIIIILAICTIGIFGLAYLRPSQQSSRQAITDTAPTTETNKQPLDLPKKEATTSTPLAAALQEALPGSPDDIAYAAAIKDKNPEGCQSITGPVARNLCFSNLAQEVLDVKVCSRITDDNTQKTCLSMVQARLGIKDRDIKKCEEVGSEMLKDACIDNNQWDIKECQSLKANTLSNRCLDRFYMRRASSSNNPGICDKISNNDLRGECIAVVKKIIRPYEDADKDGLDMLHEIIYSTNPGKADTDSDGFSDGSEVAGGYNPLGFGYMDQEKNKQFIFCEEIIDKIAKDACLLLRDKRIEKTNCERYDNMVIRGYCLRHRK